jgi:neutral ceramidase
LEAKYPGATALFFAGCGADQNPLPRRKVELASQYGRDLAASVETVLKEKLEPVTGDLQASWTQVPLELAKIPIQEEIEQEAKSADRYVSARARMLLGKLAAGESLPKTYPYPIQVWRLGSKLVLVALGGEVVVDYALAIKQQMGGERTWVAGYSNDVMAYIPSRRVLAEGGYEGAGAMVYYSLPSPWAPSVEKTILDAVQATVPAASE